jgi:hypothetical protein
MAFDTTSNRRIIYATQGVAIGDMGATSVVDSWGTSDSPSLFNASGKMIIIHGLQEFGINTNFSLEGVRELGQLSLYENVEDVPEVEITVSKVLDGYTYMYHAATVTATDPTLTGRQNARCDFRAVVGIDTDAAVSSGDNLAAELYSSGMYYQSMQYQLPAEGNFTESLTLVGNTKKWLGSGSAQLLLGSGNSVVSAFQFGNDIPDSPDSGVLRTNNFLTGTGLVTRGGNTFVTVVPDFIQGVTNNGASTGATGASTFNNCGTINTNNVHISNISISVEGSRQSIRHLGSTAPYYRYLEFPVPVNVELEVIATGGDNIDALEAVPAAGNLKNHTIQLCLDDSSVFQLGNKNKVTQVSWGGGNADGGNVTTRYSMTNNNDFVLLHSGDPMPLETGAYFKYWFT